MSTIGRIGFRAGVGAAIATVAYDVVQVLQVAGVLHFPIDEILIFATSLGIVVPFVLEMVALHHTSVGDARFWTRAGLVFERVGGRRVCRHVRARALAQRHVALRAELRVGVDDGSARDAELAREIARGRQAGAGAQRAVADRRAQLRLDLRRERLGHLARDAQQQLDRLAGLHVSIMARRRRFD